MLLLTFVLLSTNDTAHTNGDRVKPRVTGVLASPLHLIMTVDTVDMEDRLSNINTDSGNGYGMCS